MECPACHAIIQEGGSWCLACGESLNAPDRALPLDDFDFCLQRASQYRTIGLHDKALLVYQQLLQATPDSTDKAICATLIGDFFLEKNDFTRAIKAYRQAIQLHPTDETREKYDQTIDLMKKGS